MLSVYGLKPRFQAVLRPATRALARRGVTANQVTVAAMLLSVMAGAVVAAAGRWWPSTPVILAVLPVVLLLRMALNAVDGMLAREHGMQSRLGAVLNEVGDLVSDLALYLPLACVPGFDPVLVGVCVALAVTVEAVGLLGPSIGAPRGYAGPCGKSDRALVFGVVALLLACGVAAGPWIHWVLVGLSGLAVVTVVRRAQNALAAAPREAAVDGGVR